MNVLMVYPKCPDTFWGFKRALQFMSWFFFSKKASFPPLGLMTISPLLPKNWQKKLVDLNVRRLRDKDIAWADLVFISAMIVQQESAQEVINRCKLQGKKVVAGGPVFTSSRQLFTGVDHFVLNEGEITLPLFLKDLEEGTLKEVYESKEKPDLSLTPTPDWSLIKKSDYSTMMVQYSRGCPFACEFCDITSTYGRNVRVKAIPKFIAEMDSLLATGWRGSVMIVDDNFIGNLAKVSRLLPEYIKWQKENNYPFNHLIQASVNLANSAELMKLLTEANIGKAFLGIETADVASLAECGKMQNVKVDLVEAVQKIQQAGIEVMAGFIVGFDNDTEKSFDSLFSFIQRTGVVTAMVGMLNALPGTKLWDRLKVEGRLLGEPKGDQVSGYVNFTPKMGMETLITGYKELLWKIYQPKNYYARLENFLKNYRPVTKKRFSFPEVQAFFHSLWRIGIFSKSNWRYDSLMLKTIIIKWKFFSVVVEHSILGMHLRGVSRRVVKS